MNAFEHVNTFDPTPAQKGALTGTSGSPSASNAYVTNSDPRLTAAGLPAHASSHASGGTDPVTPASIGAAPNNASFITTSAETGLSAESVLGTSIILRGAFASRPAAAIAGRLYFATDDPNTGWTRDTGSTWESCVDNQARPPNGHATSHETAGSDPIDGDLDANARVGVRKGTGTTSLRRRISLIEGANMSITVADDSGSEEVDVTLNPSNVWLLGGQTLSAAKIFGAADAQDIQVQTNAADRLVVGSGGNLKTESKGTSSLPPISRGLGTQGDGTQHCLEYVLFDTFQTTNATPQNRNIYVIPGSSCILVELYFAAIRSDVAAGYAAIRRATFRRNSGLTVTQIGATSSEYSEATDLACAAGINNSSTNIRLTVTGIAATTLNWTVWGKVTVAK